jgi:nucleotide-binding universal stress UspA family protein
MRILICTDGSISAEQAALLITRMAFPEDTEYTLLGVSETDGDQVELTAAFDRLEQLLGGARPAIQRLMRYGNAVDQIKEEASTGSYDLVALGAKGHPRTFIGPRIGSTVNKVTRTLTIPVCIARDVPEKLEKILICTAAEDFSLETLRTGGRLLAGTQAEIHLLHVMSQVALRLDSPSADLRDTAETAILRGTREGKHLERGLDLLEQGGVSQHPLPVLRHGLVVDEVLAEVEEGHYDLLVIGGHFQQGRIHWIEFLLDDVSGQLLKRSSCSVLII